MRTIIAAIVIATALYVSGANATLQFTKKDLYARQAEAAKRWYSNLGPLVRDTGTNTVKNITFLNPKAAGSFLPASIYAATCLYYPLTLSPFRVLCGWD